MNTSLYRAGLLALLVASASCADTITPTAPTPQLTLPTAPTPPPPPPPTPFPGPGVYEFVPTPGMYYDPMALGSRYTLNADGTFVLQYANPLGRYPGRYAEADGRLTFDYDWNNHKAGATAVFAGDAMIVTYDFVMSFSDFQGGAYVRIP